MSAIHFTQEEKQTIIPLIQRYFREELQQELGAFDAEFLLDFFAEKIGPFFYNRAILDAVAQVQARVDDLSDGLYQLEKKTPFIRD